MEFTFLLLEKVLRWLFTGIKIAFYPPTTYLFLTSSTIENLFSFPIIPPDLILSLFVLFHHQLTHTVIYFLSTVLFCKTLPYVILEIKQSNLFRFVLCSPFFLLTIFSSFIFVIALCCQCIMCSYVYWCAMPVMHTITTNI